MINFRTWLDRAHEHAPPTCCVASWRGATPDTASLTVTGGRATFMLGAAGDWRVTDRLEGVVLRGEASELEAAWGRFLAVEMA